MNPGRSSATASRHGCWPWPASSSPLCGPSATASSRMSASARRARQGHPRRRRLVRLRLLAVRLLRRPVRPVLRPRLGEPVPARQMVLAARVHGGPREVEPEDGRHVPRLHHLRALQRALPGGPADRALLDEAARRADRRREADDLPAVRDDGRRAAQRRETSGPATAKTARLVPRRPARSTAPATRQRSSTSPAAPPATSNTTSAWPACACWTRPASTSPTSARKESCCGTPMLVAGKWDLFAKT